MKDSVAFDLEYEEFGRKRDRKIVGDLAPINRNLLHWPLNRSPAATPRWHLRGIGNDPHWTCFLQAHSDGELAVSLQLPYRGEPPRAPRRRDMDLAYRLVRMSVRASVGQQHELAFREGRKAIVKVNAERDLKSRDFLAWLKDAHTEEEFDLSDPDDKAEALRQYRVHRSLLEKREGRRAYREARSDLRDEQGHRRKAVDLHFPSLYELTRALGRNPRQQNNRRDVENSIRFLQRLRVVYYDSWTTHDWAGRQWKPEENFEFTIVKIFRINDDRSVVVKLSDEFLQTSANHFEPLQFPLLLTSEQAFALDGMLKVWSLEKLYSGTLRWRRKTLAARIGLVYDRTHPFVYRLQEAVDAVNRHRSVPGRGPRIRFELENGRVTFVAVTRKYRRKRPEPDTDADAYAE